MVVSSKPRPLALPGSNSGQVTHTCWPSRSHWSSVGVPGCRWETVRLSWQLLWSAKEKENSDHNMWSQTARKARGKPPRLFPMTGYPLGYPEPALQQKTEEREREREREMLDMGRCCGCIVGFWSAVQATWCIFVVDDVGLLHKL